MCEDVWDVESLFFAYWENGDAWFDSGADDWFETLSNVTQSTLIALFSKIEAQVGKSIHNASLDEIASASAMIEAWLEAH